MPTASDKLRNTMRLYFGGDGIGHYEPHKFLRSCGWTEDAGLLHRPDREITMKEWDCVHFLCDEWDYDYHATERR